MKTAIQTIGAVLIICSIGLVPNAYPEITPLPASVKIDTFYNGQMLYPDYVHEDTLVVTNARLLNADIQGVDCSDEGIFNLLDITTVTLSSYPEYIAVSMLKDYQIRIISPDSFQLWDDKRLVKTLFLTDDSEIGNVIINDTQ